MNNKDAIIQLEKLEESTNSKKQRDAISIGIKAMENQLSIALIDIYPYNLAMDIIGKKSRDAEEQVLEVYGLNLKD